MLLISPYAQNAVIHESDDQASVIKFVEHLFNRTPLAQLPDESRYMPFGPRDATDQTGDLSGGFDEQRLRGEKPPIAAEEAMIPDDVVRAIPSPWSCASLGLHPIPPAARHLRRSARGLQSARARRADVVSNSRLAYIIYSDGDESFAMGDGSLETFGKRPGGRGPVEIGCRDSLAAGIGGRRKNDESRALTNRAGDEMGLEGPAMPRLLDYKRLDRRIMGTYNERGR